MDRESRRLHEHVAVILNGRLLHLVGGMEARLHDGDKLLLMLAYAGG